jgi:hypothetical protein
VSPQQDLAWRIGGPQGSGVDTAAGLFSRACAVGGLHVFGRREYYSNIMGRHSYYDVRVLTGAHSATATSGPGFSLMAEGFGWAGMNEVPLVVTLYQRGGPSTGMPTRTEQGDLQFAIHAGHGEFPRLIVASGDMQEAFDDAARAFNYAERYQTVVIHLLDKALASTTQTVPPFDVEAVRIQRGEVYAPTNGELPNGAYARFVPTTSGVTPRALPGQPGGMHWLTGGEHTASGRVTEDPVVREQMLEKRAQKLAWAAREIPTAEKLQVYGAQNAPLTVVSWGSKSSGTVWGHWLFGENRVLPADLWRSYVAWPSVTLCDGCQVGESRPHRHCRRRRWRRARHWRGALREYRTP